MSEQFSVQGGVLFVGGLSGNDVVLHTKLMASKRLAVIGIGPASFEQMKALLGLVASHCVGILT